MSVLELVYSLSFDHVTWEAVPIIHYTDTECSPFHFGLGSVFEHFHVVSSSRVQGCVLEKLVPVYSVDPSENLVTHWI